MSLTKPNSGDPGYSGATKASTVIGAITDWINQHPNNVKDAANGALGDGVTDDTTAFANTATAVGAGGEMFVPPGTYILNNWTPTQSGLKVRGAGKGAVILKAKAAAAAAVTISALSRTSWEGITFDGNAAASDGVDITGAATASSLHAFRDCQFQNALVGANVLNGAPTNEADQNEFDHCFFTTNGTHLKNVATNGQQTVLSNVRMGTSTSAGIILGGSATLLWNSGQMAGYTTGIQFSANPTMIRLVDVNFQSNNAGAVDIDGSSFWPVHGVILESCVLQAGMSASSGKTVSMKAGATLYAHLCAFLYGDLTANFSNTWVEDYACTFTSSATYTGSATTSHRVSTADSSTGTITYYRGTNVMWKLDLINGVVVLPQFTTAGRPAAATAGKGAMYYDTTLSKPGWSDNTNWKDAAGTNI